MAMPPNYRFNRTPQFSLNHVSEYFASPYATQRTQIIGAAKFPRKIEVAAYTQIRRPLQNALLGDGFGRDDLDLLASTLQAKARRESGYSRDEALRCVKAVRAFQKTLKPRIFPKYQFSAAQKTLSIRIDGVKINVSLDASITVTTEGMSNSGGIILLYAFSAGRGSIRDRLMTAAGLILLALEEGQMEPLPRLCIAIDLADHKIIKASGSFARFRKRVSHSCREIAARWDAIEPPDDYDGPDWH